MDRTQISIIFAVIATNLGAIIALYIHNELTMFCTDKKIDAIQQEMNDFHGRLCDIEERNKGK